MRKLICSLLALTLTCTVFWVSAEENPVQTILSIGTTQAFTEDAVTKNDLNLIVQAGLSTASAINQQPWYFVVITNPDVMSELPRPPSRRAPAHRLSMCKVAQCLRPRPQGRQRRVWVILPPPSSFT